ncbi:RNA 2',3'-cyclic phosphodiesterase [Halorubrum sp. CBA1125]|uniref:RNA 2',3'-cyclic phosphodiesterase n=1 Tax=Halorubrum sp. CBA1125 TaxID=2668072 RepID=UPI0012E90A60|nr:RNA 2',3'-cyclic phosphodiesterase [Halorubrum sp. CBA1125]MUW15025.1 RNA 2',3'-cyclic phosphodiesterase [Halorubrum sp. CBA1125]
MRAFFAVELPDALAPAVAEVQAAFGDAEGVRLTDPAQAHCTLQFLGEVDAAGNRDDGGDGNGDADGDSNGGGNAGTDGDDRDAPTLDAVVAAGERAVERAAVEPFECAVAGLGVFPNPEYISVVWAGFEAGGEQLTALNEALTAETAPLGVEPDSHAFTPHVTLARVDDARGADAVRPVVSERHPEIGRFTVEAVELVESTLTSAGAVHETVASFPLG